MEGLRILGFPENFAKKYFTENIDELIFNDIVASLYKRNQSIEIVNKITQSIFVPIICKSPISILFRNFFNV